MSDKRNVDKYKRVSSAADNMSALIDDIIKKARKFLKESVGALRELYDLLECCDGSAQVSDGVIIRLEKQIQEWSK